MEKVVTWKGKPIEEFTREELIEVINSLATALEQEQAAHRTTLDILVPSKA